MPTRLNIHLLGQVSIQLDEQPLANFPSRKAEALLIYLACTRHEVSREVLADMLWDDRTQEQALANLRSVLSSLRRALGDFVRVTRDSVAFDVESDHWLDAQTFAIQMAELRAQLVGDGPLPEDVHDVLERTLALYRGDFLAGFHIRESRGFEEWATLERERLQRLAVSGLRRIVLHDLNTGAYVAGIDHAARLIELDPLSEEAQRDMMLLLARSGQRNAALAQYEACRRILRDELGVTPTEETIALHARIRMSHTLGAHNVPPSPTEFVGREEELLTLPRQLAHPDCRLVTILGAGGIGKTRLALETARRIVAQRPGMFLHGVCFVALAGIDTAQLLAVTLVDALGAPGGGEARDQLLDFLREREMLLVLDNFEHLLGDDAAAVDLLADVLQQAPSLKLLVTSRERLKLREEWLFDVAGLSVPREEDAAPQSHSAIRLFVREARRTQRNFEPALDEMQAIVRVCRALEGTPLGIELAAALVRRQSCAEIAEALVDSLDSLTSPLRNVPARHRSLRAVFEHSWGYLSTAQQTLFAQLSIFPDSFTQDAAVAVSDAATLDDLVDKSLLQQRSDARYQIHPLLRQYAAEKLVDAHAQQIAQRHAAFYMDFLGRQGSGEEADQRAAIRLELPNIRAAWRWTARVRDQATLGRVAVTLHSFYSIQSWSQEGIDAFQFAVDQFTSARDDPAQAAPLLCDLLGRKARMHIYVGQIDAARAALEQSLIYLQHVDDADRRSTILGYLAITHYYAGDYARAAELARESLQLSEQSGSREGIAFAYNFMGSCAKALGDYAQARNDFERSAEVYRSLDDGIGAAMVINNLGNLAQAMGDIADAQQFYRECSDLFKAHDHVHGAATVLANAGLLAIRQGGYEQARQLLSESLTLKREINDQRGMAVALSGLVDVAVVMGEYVEAREQMQQALSLARKSNDVKLMLDVLVTCAALALKQNRSEMATRLLAYTLQHKATTQESRERAQGLAAELGGLPAEALAEARSDVRDLGEVVEEVLASSP